MSIRGQILNVGQVGTRKYNVANVVCDVEQFLGYLHFQNDQELLRQSAEVCRVALLPVFEKIIQVEDFPELSHTGLEVWEVCELLKRATKVSDDPDEGKRRVSILRVCRAALYRILTHLNGCIDVLEESEIQAPASMERKSS